MTRVMQSDFQKLIAAAAKLLPTKTALKGTIWIESKSIFILGQGRATTKTISPYFAGVTLEASGAGFLSATVHTYENGWIAYLSVPFTIPANVDTPFRITVYADALLPLVKLCDKREVITLSIAQKVETRNTRNQTTEVLFTQLEMAQGRNVDRFNAIAQHTFYDVAYEETTKSAPGALSWIITPAPLMLPAPKIAGLLCAGCDHEQSDFYTALDEQHIAAMEAEYGEKINLQDYSIEWLHAQYQARGDTRQSAYDVERYEANARLTARILQANPDLQWVYQLYEMKMAAAKVSAEPDSRYTIISTGGGQ